MLLHKVTIIIIIIRYLGDCNHCIGSVITPRLISTLFKYPVWSPLNKIVHTTVIATPAVIDGEYNIKASIVRGFLGICASIHANMNERK
ncbi:hypothetical protein SDC9_171511 [bioreactor metagenome]|uniref:Uncharacterized protein n=1 Tax=bioreactor metagenome TaxID=1076179 RepID=A0A645GB26_9ZZZZ